jgi:hypothetical protein
MNAKRVAIATVIGFLCGLFCAYGTVMMDDPSFMVTTGILVSIVYNRVLIGFVVGIGDGIKLHPALRGALIGIIISMAMSIMSIVDCTATGGADAHRIRHRLWHHRGCRGLMAREITGVVKGGLSMEEKEDLIAYCGLYCGDCHGYRGKIPDLARDLRKELRAARYDKLAAIIAEQSWGKIFADYEKCYELLGAMMKFRCKVGCRQGGGPPFCKIRTCCQRKEIQGCWECEEFETCGKLDFLRHVHGYAHLQNLRTLKKKGAAEFLKGKRYWYRAEKAK